MGDDMLVCVDWIREITPFEVGVEELAETLTMLGLEVEEILSPFEYLNDVVVGVVVECLPHPNADKLKICDVDIGGEVLKIVCGAPNVQKGQIVPVAKIGARLPDIEVKKVKIRGVESYGMICSEKELGIGDDHTGIMVLDKSFSPGTPIIHALNLDFKVFDVGITPNRGDCLSVIGIAREIAAFYNLPIRLPEVNLSEVEDPINFGIEINSPFKCFLYQAKIIKGVKVSPSPAKVRYRLLACGIRPINNIVDITNYIMLETGHPLHAFDLDLIEGGKIVVETAKEGEEFVTLDGKVRRLNSEDLLIKDGKKPVALAGIMGGENSEIRPNTKNVLLECAVFDPISVRKTARRLGISSEASYRFERGVDQKEAEYPLKRAAYLMQKYAEGKVLKGIAKAEPKPWVNVEITFRPSKVKDLLGFEIHKEKCLSVLKRLGCKIEEEFNNTSYKVYPPSYRHDLLREVDLIEEVARFCGYNEIPDTLPKITKFQFPYDTSKADVVFIDKIKNWAKGLGLREIITYSFVSFDELRLLGYDEKSLIKIRNPLSSDQDTLRPVIFPGLLRTLQYNLNQNNKNLRFFEIASVFFPDKSSDTKAKEVTKLGILIQGVRYPDFWPWERARVDYFDIKGIVEHLFESLKLYEFNFETEESHPYLEPCVKISLEQREVGILGKPTESIYEFYDIKDKNVWIAEIDLDQLFKICRTKELKFKPWSKYPPVFRDMTIILLEDIKFNKIKATLKEADVPYLEDLKLIDVYWPSLESKPHFTLRFVYRHPYRTLTDEEVDELHMKLGKYILEKLPIRFP